MQDIKDRVEEALEFLDNLPKDDSFRREIDASIRFAETIKELTEREAKLVDALKVVADSESCGEGSIYTMNDTGILIRCQEVAKKTLEELGY